MSKIPVGHKQLFSRLFLQPCKVESPFSRHAFISYRVFLPRPSLSLQQDVYILHAACLLLVRYVLSRLFFLLLCTVSFHVPATSSSSSTLGLVFALYIEHPLSKHVRPHPPTLRTARTPRTRRVSFSARNWSSLHRTCGKILCVWSPGSRTIGHIAVACAMRHLGGW